MKVRKSYLAYIFVKNVSVCVKLSHIYILWPRIPLKELTALPDPVAGFRGRGLGEGREGRQKKGKREKMGKERRDRRGRAGEEMEGLPLPPCK